MRWLNSDTRKFFLSGMRYFFGIWFLYVGLWKWTSMGHGVFVEFITSQFDKTWSPHALNAFLAWVILVAEPLLALLILSGRKVRLAWTLTSCFLFMLTAGQTILLKPEVITNWQYLVLTLACAALSGPDEMEEHHSGSTAAA